MNSNYVLVPLKGNAHLQLIHLLEQHSCPLHVNNAISLWWYMYEKHVTHNLN